jgi:tRNA/rRNA methyltransferase
MNLKPNLQGVRIVLSRTSHPGNIGAAARAMKTMGLRNLVLVQPKTFPHAEAEAMASGATDVLATAHVVKTLADALAGTVFAVAMTARPRDLSHPAVAIREAAVQALAESVSGDIALVFGNETYGLSNEEADLCQLIGMIPANPAYSSLNLAAAVQVACYELAQAAAVFATPENPVRDAATHEEVEGFLAHLESKMIDDGFLDPDKPKRLMTRLRRLFARSRLEKEEVAILRGVLAARKKK